MFFNKSRKDNKELKRSVSWSGVFFIVDIIGVKTGNFVKF